MLRAEKRWSLLLQALPQARVRNLSAKGMPLVVEVSVAFSVLVALVVIGVFLFRIAERFETVDAHALDRFRGDQR